MIKRFLFSACFSALFASISFAQVDESPMTDVVSVKAFSNLEILRPIVLTHAGDGSNRLFIASQMGKVYVMPNKDDVTMDEAQEFLDLESKVVYYDKQNEEGLLGMCFHPNYKKTGEFFIYYTTKDTPQTSVISRFKVSKDNPQKADPASEEEIMRIKQPFWNHNGGTMAFGKDGYLYIALGDGGKANDPFENGQNLETLLGSILRIDIDHKDEGKNYAVPKDNPFVNTPKAQPEIWAYGVRNIWRIAFDRETGVCWAADVGQDLWEEINIIEKGGNYGWNIREGKHPFGPKGVGPRADLIEPIWEYEHLKVGKSITGGQVYRGKQVPALVGAYLYADYVTGKVWALRYDFKAKQVTSNRQISGNIFPIFSFGEDEQGEVYFLRAEGFIHRFQAKAAN